MLFTVECNLLIELKNHSFTDICLCELFFLFEEFAIEVYPSILYVTCISSILILSSRLLLALLSRFRQSCSNICPISVTWHMPMPPNLPLFYSRNTTGDYINHHFVCCVISKIAPVFRVFRARHFHDHFLTLVIYAIRTGTDGDLHLWKTINKINVFVPGTLIGVVISQCEDRVCIHFH